LGSREGFFVRARSEDFYLMPHLSQVKGKVGDMGINPTGVSIIIRGNQGDVHR